MTLSASHISLKLHRRLILDDISVNWNAGLIGLVGPNGAGKSSFLRVLAGLWRASSGDVQLNGRDIHAISAQARATALSLLPSERDISWPLPVGDVVALGRHPHRGAFAEWTEADQAAVETAVTAVDAHHLLDRPISELSNGERARVLLARALAVDAPVLLVDEAIAALDPAHQLQVMEVLSSEAKKDRLVVAVLHDLGLARRFCDQIVMMNSGQIHAQGAAEDVLRAEHLRTVYGIEALVGNEGGQPFVVPVRRVPVTDPEPS